MESVVDISKLAHWYSRDCGTYIHIWEVKSYQVQDHGLVVNLDDKRIIVIEDTDDAANFIIGHMLCREWAAQS